MNKILKALFVMAMLLVFLGCGQQTPEKEWISLFNGENLQGWENPYDWGEAWVDSGAIHLKADKKFFLVTEQEFSDFIFEGEVKLPEGESNSGFMFRCNVDTNRVYGYQAEVDPSERKWFGGLYDEARRGWLHPVRDDSASVAAFRTQAGEVFKRYDWNKYKIKCTGDHIQIFVNGVKTTDYHDSEDAAGFIGIQHHGEEGQVYQFRNLRISEIKNIQ